MRSQRRKVYLVAMLIALILTALHTVFNMNSNMNSPSPSRTNALSSITLEPYIEPRQFTELRFGTQSHWLQPWRAYLETVPAKTFLDGIGAVFKVSEPTSPALVAQMLAKQGVRVARFEIGWGQIDYDDETRIRAEDDFRSRLLGLQQHGIRPLILLNANQGRPCPLRSLTRTVTGDAAAGDLRIQLDDVSELQVGYSGISDLTENWAAEALITNISNRTVTLSKPLPQGITAGTSVEIDTLKYRPFAPPDSEDYQNTIAGWRRYADTVAAFVTDVLGTTEQSDKGFDMEIWNELSFGSKFLNINQYYTETPYDYGEAKEGSVRKRLVEETAAYARTHPEHFQGVKFTNGFASTIPWPASSLQPLEVVALSKHPYPKFRQFPQDENKGRPMNALYQEEDKDTFVPPTYSVLFPEYSAAALQSSTIVRDMGPITSDIYNTEHGRYARVVNSEVVPTSVWITEANINPFQYDRSITEERASTIQAKTVARYLCFFLNKGVTRLYLFAAGKENGMGIVKQNFLDYVEQPNAQYPADDSIYTSLTLTTVGRLVRKMSEQVDLNLRNPRQLEVVSVGDSHNHAQFTGDGTEAHPNLFDREVFVVLPYQVNARRFIIPYYVMTRDVMQDLPPEAFTVQIKGLRSDRLSVTVYDPIQDKTVPVTVRGRGSDTLSLDLTATDYPYLLTIEEDRI
jgi:hypothetical protein